MTWRTTSWPLRLLAACLFSSPCRHVGRKSGTGRPPTKERVTAAPYRDNTQGTSSDPHSSKAHHNPAKPDNQSTQNVPQYRQPPGSEPQSAGPPEIRVRQRHIQEPVCRDRAHLTPCLPRHPSLANPARGATHGNITTIVMMMQYGLARRRGKEGKYDADNGDKEDR